MKTKIFLPAIFFLFCSAVVIGQNKDRRVWVALNVQPKVNWFHPNETHLKNGPVRMGFEGGLRLDYRIEKWYSLSFGLNLSQTGGNLSYADTLPIDLGKGLVKLQPGTKVTYRLQYFELPVAMKFVLPEIGYSTLFVEIGLDPMFNSRAVIDATDNNIQKESYKDGIHKFNLAWHTGLGMNYSLGGMLSLQFAIVYKNTFLDVTKENELQKKDNSRINQVGLTVGIVF